MGLLRSPAGASSLATGISAGISAVFPSRFPVCGLPCLLLQLR